MLRWLLVVLCLAGVPAALVYFSVYRFYTVSEDELKFKIKAELQQAANEAVGSLDQEAFWCQLFYEQFSDFEKEKTEPAGVLIWLADLQKQFPGEFEFIAWNADGKELQKTFKDEYSQNEWLEVFNYLSAYPGLQVSYTSRKNDITVVRKILGPQLIPGMLTAQSDPERYSLCWLDSSFKRPPITRYFITNIAVVILYNQQKLKANSGLRYSLKKFARKGQMTLGLVSLKKGDPQIIWQSNDVRDNSLSGQTFKYCENESVSFLELSGHYLGFLFLAPDLRIFALAPKEYDNVGIIWRSLLAAAFYALLMLPFLLYTWRTLIAERPGRATIKTRLAFLFIFACGIPLLAMTVVSHELNSQRRRTLMSEAHQNSADMIVSFDRRFRSFIDSDAMSLDRLFDNWITKNAGKELTHKLTIGLDDQLKPYEIGMYYVVASESEMVINRGDILVLKGGFDAASIDREKSQMRRSLSSVIENDTIAANLVGKKIMSDLNRVEISAQTLSKLEIVAESLLQQSILGMTNSVIGNLGKINNWGYGRFNDLSFVKLISVFRPGIVDYACMVFWRPIQSQTRFIKKAVPLANRNAHGYRLIARNRFSGSFFPEIASQSSELRKFASRLGARPTEEIELINYAGEDYVAVGFNGRNVTLFQLIALCPLRNIELIIGQRKTEMVLFILFSILLAASLAQILARSFIDPLHALLDGALAVENREFSHRISNVGKDEFGEVAAIFNEVMVGFSELEVARIVQDSLFPPPRFEHGRFVIFGKSISMSELGGDYFDFFAVDDRHFAVLAGDVAGHGVGAALIMAMAKAGILSSPTLLKSPAELMLALHKMIMAAKGSQQKKIMTFQYLYLDSEKAVGSYSNAGGCSPMIVRAADMSVEEFTLAGPALGAFSSASYNETKLEFASGDAIVFYTDGIIEALSPDGAEIGYEGFNEMLQSCYSTDPQIFYQNIYDSYLRHIGDSGSQDDLTIIVTVCTEQKESSNIAAEIV